MRATVMLASIIIISMVLAGSFSAHEVGSQPNASQLIVQVERKVEVMNAGIVTINDTITFKAQTGTVFPISSLKLGNPSFFSSELQSFQMLNDSQWRSLSYRSIILPLAKHNFYEVELPSQVVLQADANLTIKASYFAINQVSLRVTEYSALIPLYPSILLYNITSFKFNMTLPVGSILKTIVSDTTFKNSTANGIWTIAHNASDLLPLMYENVTVRYTPSSSDAYLIDLELLQRSMTIFQGSITVDDKHVLVNKGISFNTFELKLPKDAYDIKAYDSVGTLLTVHQIVEGNDSYTKLVVAPRSSVRQSDRWVLTVEYSLPGSGLVRNEGDKYAASIQIEGNQFYIRNLTLIVALPEGASFESSTPQPASVIQTSQYTQQVTFASGSIVPRDRSTVTINYLLPFIWTIFRPLQWILIAALIVGSVYILRRRRPSAEKKPVAAKRTDLDSLLELYKERIALLVELEELDHDLDRKAVSREHFDRRTAEISRRQQEILRNIGRLEGLLETTQPSIANKLQVIKNAEADLDRASNDLRSLDTRFRAKRISRSDYAQKHREALKRLGQARRRIEQVIASLEAGS